jgi:hypothetical protein
VSHRGSNGGLLRTRSIEMTCAVEWAEHNDMAIACSFNVKGWAGDDDRALDSMLELADVAGPIFWYFETGSGQDERRCSIRPPRTSPRRSTARLIAA